MLRSSQNQSVGAPVVPIVKQNKKAIGKQQNNNDNDKRHPAATITTESSLSGSLPLADRIIQNTTNAMWSSGYPATHMLLSRFLRKSVFTDNAIVPILCVAAALEIIEEFF